MDVKVFFCFVAATALMIALPGPSVMLAVAHSVSFGWKRSLATVLGATLGIAAQLLVAVFGIGFIIQYLAAAFGIVRWLGAGYLVFVGIRTWMQAKKGHDVAGGQVPAERLLLQGFLVTVFNPKSLLFMAAFLPQFIDAKRSVYGQFMIVIPTFLLITFFVTSLWSVLSGLLVDRTSCKFELFVVFRISAACIMLTGIGMIFAY